MMAARLVFTRTIQRMGLSADTPVAVVVTGGSDSLALTLLARQAFRKVIGITVDHRLREENALEVKRAGELVRSLGVEHHIVSLDWGEERKGGRGGREGGRGKKLLVPPRSLAIVEKKHQSMLGFCQRMNIRTLMIAHHLDDQIETFLLRMALRSNVDDLGGRFLNTVRAKFPQVNIIRPFLEVRKADLQEVCQNEGVEWIEDQLDGSIRSHIHGIVQQNEELVPGIAGLIKTCQEARRQLKYQANESLSKIDLSVNEEYGYLSFSISRLLSLPPIVLKKVIQLLTAHIGGERRSLNRHHTFARFQREVLSQNRQTTVLNGCTMFVPEKDSDTMIMGKAPPEPAKQVWTPISVRQTVHWDKRWKITLKPLEMLSQRDGDRKAPDRRVVQNKEQFYVRYVKIEECWRKDEQDNTESDAEIPPFTRLLLGLPVVCRESGHVVLAPHFNILNHSYGVDCDVTFDPLLPLIQDLDTIIY